MHLVDSDGNATIPANPIVETVAEPEIVPVRSVTPRNGFVMIRLLPRPKQRMKGSIYLPDAPPLGSVFEQAIIVKVGRGILLDSGLHGGTDDLKPGMRVVAKIGDRVPQQNRVGGIAGQEVRSVYSMDVEGEEQLVMINHHDILSIINED